MNVTVTQVPFKVDKKTLSYLSFLDLLLEKSIQESEQMTFGETEKFNKKELKIIGKMPWVNKLLRTLKNK